MIAYNRKLEDFKIKEILNTSNYGILSTSSKDNIPYE